MRTAIGLIALFVTARAHMSPFLDAMYGGPKDYPGLQNPVMPLGPELEFDDWWFRGPDVRNAPPKSGAVAILPAGGDYTLEIACAPEYTTYDGNEGTGNVACDEPGPYHADPAALKVDPALFSGCAIGISDVMDPNDATMDDFTIISVQSECISDRDTTFSIPARMPSCTGEWCICGWVWLPQTGDANAYHTPFRCKISDSPADARPIASPQDPVFCPDSRDDCTKGAKKMISTYNYPVNVPFTSYADRPGYHGTFGFFNGPQDDIFLAPSPSPSPSTSTISTKTTAETSSTLSSVVRSNTISPSSQTTSSSQIVWTRVPTTTPQLASSRFATATTSSTIHSHRPALRDRTTTTTKPQSTSTRSPRLPFASRLSLLPITTIGTSSPSKPTRAARKTFKERQLEIGISLERKGISHSLKRRKSFGSLDTAMSLGMADRLVERMKKVVTRERRELEVAGTRTEL